MIRTIYNKLLPGLAGLGALVFSTGAFAVPENNTIEFSNCTLSMPGSPATASARCGFLEVPENPGEPDGRKISIHVAVAEASSQSPQADPLFFFAGGPGQAASETWVMIRSALRKVRKDRDIVLIDQRGTGQSNKLACPATEEIDLNAEIDLDEIVAETERCLETLDGDPRFYTTTIAMSDYDAVRRAMGYEQINLMGVSYGTRAAQVYLRNYPESVRTIILDSVVPMQLALGQEHAPRLDEAVDKVLDDCAADETCASLFPDPRAGLTQLFRELREQSRQTTITHPVTGQEMEVRLSAETLAVAIRFLSYSSESQALLPLLLNEAVNTGNLDRLASQALLVMSGLSEMIARGMEMSVMCSEDYPLMDMTADHSDTILGNIMMEGIQAQCAIWPRGEVPDNFHDPIDSDRPALLLSGERDPVTPPVYAAMAAEGFSEHINIVAAGQAHSVLRNVCLQEIANAFIQAGTTSEIDTSCADNIAGSPFFTSLLGPAP